MILNYIRPIDPTSIGKNDKMLLMADGELCRIGK